MAEHDIEFVVLSAMAFSAMSIVLGIVTAFTRNGILRQKGWVSVQFEVIGSSITDHGHQNIVNPIKQDMAVVVGMDHHLVEVLRPYPIDNGLRMTINLYVKDTDTGNVSVIEGLVKENQAKGTLSETFRRAWNLKKAPSINEITVWRIEAVESCLQRPWAPRTSVSSAVSLSTWSPYDGKSSVHEDSVEWKDDFPFPHETIELVDVSGDHSAALNITSTLKT